MDMDMDTVTNSQEKNEVTDGELEIYRDAFLPQPSLRRNKPWDRAPVAAHAPRLAGQKIWKKPSFSMRSTNQTANEDKENAVDAELEKGGKGSRKRMRGAVGKENITRPVWMDVVDVKGEQLGVEEFGGSPRKRGWNQDALVVPRKRTNANHLITPRKALGRVEGNISVVAGVQSSMSALLNGVRGEEPRRRKSKGVSWRISSEDLVAENSSGGEAMMRRESFDINLEVGISNRYVGLGTSLTVEAFQGIATSPSVLLQSPVITPVLEEPQTSENFSPQRESISETLSEQDAQELADQQATEPETLNKDEKTSPSQQDAVSWLENEMKGDDSTVSLNDKEHNTDFSDVETALPISQNIAFDIIEGQELSQSNQPPLFTIQPTGLETIAEQPPQTTHKIVAELDSIAMKNVLDPATPVKYVQTPISKRKAAQRWGTRRSTRNTRVSSAQEEIAMPIVGGAQESAALKNIATVARMNSAETPVKNAVASAVDGPEVALEDAESEDGEPRLSAETRIQSEPVSQQSLETVSNKIREITETGKVSLEKQHIPKEQHLSGLGEDEVCSEDVEQQAEEISERQIPSEFLVKNLLFQKEEEISPPEPKRNSILGSPSQDVPIISVDSLEQNSEEAAKHLELIDPISIPMSNDAPSNPTDQLNQELRETSTPDSTIELTETISDNTIFTTSEQDDTDMLRDFLTRVKAKKAAKAKTSIPSRKRSLPHSPIQIPLETVESISSPSLPNFKNEFDISAPGPALPKGHKRDHDLTPSKEGTTEPRPIRRSGRTRLPGKAASTASSLIPVRRIGQDGDSTVTLRCNEDKELAALTKFNTRKNKGGAMHPNDFLANKAEEKEDAVSRKRALKDVFAEKEKQGKAKASKKKSVVWAEDLVQFQNNKGSGKGERDVEKEKRGENVSGMKEKKTILQPNEKEEKAAGDKKTLVKTGMRSKMTLSMAANGTQAPISRSRRA
ncbi:hypothetical protein PZA11_001045 [Diplocarpon coronariae]